MKAVFFTLILMISFLLGSKVSNAQNSLCDPNNIPNLSLGDARQCQSDLEKALNLSINATKPSQLQLNVLKAQISAIKDRVAVIENELADKRIKIEKGYADLTKQKESLDKTIANFYIKSYYDSPFILLLSNSSALKILQNLAFQQALANQDREKIVNFALLLTDLGNQQKSLESEQAQLTTLKSSLDEQSAKLNKLIQGALAYQSSLTNLISQLSARQQEILGRRLSALGIPLFASSLGACSSDIGKPPNFSGGFGLFTYGVPNRVGLNQYGALGRAKANPNQGYEEILRAYYNFDSIEPRDAQISVQGYDSYSLDEYVKRIYEVPNSWGDEGGMEALRAQAIAARSYALAYTNNGAGSICTTEQCQVFQPGPKGGNWDQAVRDTAGKVMVQGGNPIKAWFSSTHGGYAFPTSELPGWSATSWTKRVIDTATGSVNSFADLKSNAYDKDSPWFYCDWGSRPEQNKTAWLRNDEIADIANVIMLVQATNGDQEITKHLYQTDEANPAGTDTWDAGRVKTELTRQGGTPFDSVSSASVTSVDFGSGKTNTVTINGRGFPGDLFKTYFNLRAPKNIQIVGPLYDIEPVH